MARRTTRVGPSSGKGISNFVAFSNLSADFNLSDPLTNFTPSSFEPCPNNNISSALAEPGTIRGSFTVRKRLSSSPPTGKLKGHSWRFRQGARAATAFPPYHDDMAMPKLPPAPGGTCELPADSCVAFRTVGQGGRQ